MFCEIKAVLVIDSDGMKIYGKYYRPTDQLATASGQDLFEKQLKSKVSKFSLKNKENEIVLLESMTVIFKLLNNVCIYIIGSNDENEILMASILDTMVEALEIVYRTEVDRTRIIEEIDLLMLTIDEMIDDGNILAFEATSIVERVLMREANEIAQPKQNVKESLFGRALQNAKQAISKTMSSRK